MYYFYVQDADFGPAFIKVATYMPYPVKVCLNGHEWAKQQLRQAGVAFEALDNGFRSCADPAHLQTLCAQLGPDQVQAFFEKWVARLPWPLTAADRPAGYHHRLSIWQMEVSRTHVFPRPVQGREFFEQVIRENLDLGRPDRVQLIFGRRVYRNSDLRPVVQAVLNVPPEAYTASQMSYELRRLRLKGLIARMAGSQVYILTSYGRRVAYLMTKLQNRIFNVAGLALATATDLPATLARAFREIDAELERLVANARLAPAGI